MAKKPIVGIDLGTTYSALAVFDPATKEAHVVGPDDDGGSIVPSVVAFPDSLEEFVVGLPAKNVLSDKPETVVQFAKQYMDDPQKRWTIHGKEFSPTDISAHVLKKLKTQCKNGGEFEASDVVITVPAAFDNTARESTKAAAEIAGLKVIQLINEPTAAVVYYASKQATNGKVMIYDFGGGTFDVTIANVRNGGGEVEVLTSAGDTKLGGYEFDREIVKIVNEEYKAANNGNGILRESFFENWDETSLSPTEQQNYWKMMKKAESVKRELSSRDERNFVETLLDIGTIKFSVSRERFEKAISGYITQAETLMGQALENANLTKSQIDKIILVGGSTRVPAIRASIEKFIGKAPESVGNVDEAVALGAAIVAANRNKEIRGSQICIKDVCNKYFGTICLNNEEEEKEINSIILQKDTPLPCQNTETYYTIVDSQRHVDCQVTECDIPTDDPELVTIIAGKDKDFLIELPYGLSRGSALRFTYKYDESQILHISIELPNGEIVSTDLTHSATGFSISEIRRKQRDLDKTNGTDSPTSSNLPNDRDSDF